MAYTSDSIRRFMQKHSFGPEDICYILRRDGSTCIHLLDGRVEQARIPLGHFERELPEEDFLRVNKDVLLCVRQVVNVNRGRYLMTDGATLEGRHHGTRCHTEFLHRMLREQAVNDEPGMLLALREKFSAFDELPVPFCVIQLVFDLHGRGTTFIFRYCNRMMETLGGHTIREMEDHSFYEIFRNGDDKWLVKYGDIARNGGRRVFREYSPEVGKDLVIVCYQVARNFCGCLVYEAGCLDQLAEGEREPEGLS